MGIIVLRFTNWFRKWGGTKPPTLSPLDIILNRYRSASFELLLKAHHSDYNWRTIPSPFLTMADYEKKLIKISKLLKLEKSPKIELITELDMSMISVWDFTRSKEGGIFEGNQRVIDFKASIIDFLITYQRLNSDQQRYVEILSIAHPITIYLKSLLPYMEDPFWVEEPNHDAYTSAACENARRTSLRFL